jgi:glycosyltransferase involved in cell wall biosynthesis
MTSEITAHMIVRNEDQYIWYAINSILPYVSRFLIYDTGSEDNTVEIIKSIKSEKIQFMQKPITNVDEIKILRQKQIDETETDWLWVIDGDEIYSDELSDEIISFVKTSKKMEGIVVGRYDLLGDIYHYQSETVGTYDIFGRQGHYVLRLLHKSALPGLHLQGTYPYEGYYDEKGIEVIHHEAEKYTFTSGKMLHAMYLRRSSQGANLVSTFHRNKWKIETGKPIPAGYQFPQVIQKPHPVIVPDISSHRSFAYEIAAYGITPIKQLKRKFIRPVI